MSTTETVRAWATTNAGNAAADAAISSSDAQSPDTIDNNIRSVMAAVKKQMNDIGGSLVAGGTANALTVTTGQVLESGQMTDGLRVLLKATADNTSTTVTFAPDGLTAASIKRADGSGLAVGSIKSGMYLDLVYNSGSSEWRCANVAPVPVGASLGSAAASFSSNKNGTNQAISSTTATKLTFTTEEFDAGSYYDTVNSKWTPPAGTVIITAAARFNSVTAGNGQILYIYKNGVAVAYDELADNAGLASSSKITRIFQCNGTDYFEIYGQSPSDASYNVNGSVLTTWFSGSMI